MMAALFSVKINEIYKSIQGESSYAGIPFVFIRTSGCNLRCRWCDTAYAFEEGSEKSVESILEAIHDFGCRHVLVTGGEPLLQEESFPLISTLLDAGYLVLVETSGSLPINPIDPRATIILDIKCPGSGMSDRMVWENLRWLKENDEVKFVLANRHDYDWAKEVLTKYDSIMNKIVHFSPVFGEIDPQALSAWILKDRLPVRLQLQIHKYIWDASMEGV